jgi:hypothetical protein
MQLRFDYSLSWYLLIMRRYLVTDLMQTDLRTILAAKSIGHEFVQFFLYQILVSLCPWK